MAAIVVFQKKLTTSDVKDRLCLPKNSLNHLLNLLFLPFQREQLNLEFDVSPLGAARPLWNLRVTRRRSSTQPRAVITRASWSAIVRFGKLEAGDYLTVIIEDGEYPRCKLVVGRIGIKLLGTVIPHPDGIWYRLI